MFKKVLTFGLLACALAFAACSDKEDDMPAENAPAATAPAVPEIAFGQGFYDLEKEGANSWRWMSEQGVAKLKNTGKDMKLHIVGDVPADQIKSEQNFKVSLNGETLEAFSSKAGIDKEYSIPAAKLGSAPTVELIIAAEKFFIPKQFDPKSSDERKLSFSLKQLTWEAK